jgi:4-hydroxythreonine-4-phosphate dehydrogenase
VTQTRPLIVTQGDPAGIGPEITLKAWLARKTDIPAFAVLADPAHLHASAQALSVTIPIREVTIAEAASVFPRALPVVPLARRARARPGAPDTAHAASVIEAIERAVAFASSGAAAAVVTNPIAKHVLYEAGFRHPGHTEFLAALAAKPGEAAPHPVMMLWSEALAVVPVTVHMPLKAVPQALTTELIVRTARIVVGELQSRFGLARPRLSVAGLNPHAGEDGALGGEDSAVIGPAVETLRREGVSVEGPLPADTMFHPRARERYDAALAMYHDQALIPIKTIAFDEAVNVTLGLPFVRTSPDHGTAFDIAGRGVARPDSLIAALRLAGRLGASGP